MKKILALMVLFPLVVFGQSTQTPTNAFYSTTWDTVSFVTPGAAGSLPTAYTANDVVGYNATANLNKWLKFRTPARQPGWGGFITAATMSIDTPSTAGAFTLILVSDTVSIGDTIMVPKVGDNLPYRMNDTVAVVRLPGEITFVAPSSVGTGSTGVTMTANNLNIPFRTKANQSYIFGYLVNTVAWTPKPAGRIRLKLWFDRN